MVIIELGSRSLKAVGEPAFFEGRVGIDVSEAL